MDHVTSPAPQASRPPASRADRHAWSESGVEDLGRGLYRIPLPLPGDALKAVNVYAIAGDDGVDLIAAMLIRSPSPRAICPRSVVRSSTARV